ncbi:conserved hypothetical protein [Alkaliphilus metalliredigens QYMF]|uniref:GIY-YIG domain-containing protein n=1 Tax=Alkaliphilus metalliredigens (strain QYMF) TaxID=293826 RepID=A6TPE2_ALKMQ|nr:GIY-YIG nuclease family protein [Alkaliphilus metalliredigens]ABR48060.1 conserved hypothetical protein [Alkaliphilus metalliredigens QYMF]
MDRKKELKEIYKNTKPDMGIYIVRSNTKEKCHIEGTEDLKGTMNSARFKLNSGNYPNRELQEDWNKKGPSGFTMEILENLECPEDEIKDDYKEELTILKMIWEEKLSKRGLEFYKR